MDASKFQRSIFLPNPASTQVAGKRLPWVWYGRRCNIQTNADYQCLQAIGLPDQFDQNASNFFAG